MKGISQLSMAGCQIALGMEEDAWLSLATVSDGKLRTEVFKLTRLRVAVYDKKAELDPMAHQMASHLIRSKDIVLLHLLPLEILYFRRELRSMSAVQNDGVEALLSSALATVACCQERSRAETLTIARRTMHSARKTMFRLACCFSAQ